MNKRTIRSFVVRDGRISPKAKLALKELSCDFLHQALPEAPLPSLAAPVFFPKHREPFARYVLEIGFGMGDVLLQSAAASSDTGFIGIDVHLPGIAKTLLHLFERDLTNLHLIQGDAVSWLAQFPRASLDEIWVYYPDPWPKKRHHKRRLIQASFLQALYPVLKTQGVLHMRTDHDAYAEAITAVLNDQHLFSYERIENPEPLGSKFESRALKEGRQTYLFVCKKGED